MQSSQSDLNELKQRHQQLSAEVVDQIQRANQLQGRLKSVITPFLTSLQRQLTHRPRPRSSSYWKTFQDYWRSFELFGEKLMAVSQQLILPLELPTVCSKPPVLATEEDWIDAVDDLEDLHDTLRLQRSQRASLLAIIELLDSTERLLRLRIPQVRNTRKGQKFAESLHSLKRTVRKLKSRLHNVLAEYGVFPIPLSLHDYPAPETTRIIARRDNHADDNVIIIELVTTGYTWRAGLLRKADVVVASSIRSIN